MVSGPRRSGTATRRRAVHAKTPSGPNHAVSGESVRKTSQSVVGAKPVSVSGWLCSRLASLYDYPPAACTTNAGNALGVLLL